MRKFLFIVFIVLMAFPWVSQAFYRRENIWEPIGANIVVVVLFFIILKWGKP